MAKTVIASNTKLMTDGQIEDAVAKFRAALTKRRTGFTADAVQQALGVDNLGVRLLEPLQVLIESFSSFFIRMVAIDPAQSNEDLLTRRIFFGDRSVAKNMPTSGGEKTVYFFSPRPSAFKNGAMSCQALADEYAFFGLEPDPRAVAMVNKDDPAFANTKPNAVQWKDKDGNWCYALFCRCLHGRYVGDKRCVCVDRRANDWDDGYVFGGVPVRK